MTALHTNKYFKHSKLVLVIGFFFSFPSISEDNNNTHWTLDMGVGSIISPEYMGSSSYKARVIPYIDIRYGERFFLNVPQGVGGYLVKYGNPGFGYEFGGSIAPNFQNRDAEDFPGLPDISMAVEARLFGSFKLYGFSLNAIAAKDIASGHEGAYLDLNLGFGLRLDEDIFNVSIGTRLADQSYMNSFYQIRPENTQASGLMAYTPDSNLEKYTASLFYLKKLSDKWRLSLIANANFLQKGAKLSPIVDKNNSFTVISALTYRF
ncbi:MipA/OmpV family protein [Temperatibacter marinus]|uniref:MipA/OmpV family protein n=1 Tax=Temperatibacter marinus TaxID=1456591 RepID=A0AA52H9U3_9PROT|nr:MipA/OmpV family protein [Temperatibacter marinus]WND01958.1 MipA/OmpV family protein [Temperatibacter marinus]